MTEQALTAYLRALPRGAGCLTVTGHPAPDTDAVVSALFEAWRLQLSGTPAAPLMQDALPREAAWLLGEVAALLPVGPVATGARLVLTDHHDMAAYAAPVTAVVDHHPLSPATDLSGVAAELAPVGAATTLVARRIRRDGHTPDAACARMLLGAIAMDTDGLSPHKATPSDCEMAAWLAPLCGETAAGLYAALQAEMLCERDVAVLYRRDYRRYTDAAGVPVLGFAILKVWADACPEDAAVRRLLGADTAAPTRVAKVVLFDRASDTRVERYFAAGVAAPALLAAVRTAAGESALPLGPDGLLLGAACAHPGRKRLADRLISHLTDAPSTAPTDTPTGAPRATVRGGE